jgi:hypothetical protein
MQKTSISEQEREWRRVASRYNLNDLRSLVSRREALKLGTVGAALGLILGPSPTEAATVTKNTLGLDYISLANMQLKEEAASRLALRDLADSAYLDFISRSLCITELAAAPYTPASGVGVLYAKTDGKLYFKNDDGTEIEIGASGVIGTKRFRAYRSVNQNIPAGTEAKVQFNAESYDPENVFDSVTNFRYQPGVEGLYLLCAAALLLQLPDGKRFYGKFNVNGNEYAVGTQGALGGLANPTPLGVAPIWLGASDYVEYIVYNGDSTARNISAGEAYTWMAGFRVM